MIKTPWAKIAQNPGTTRNYNKKYTKEEKFVHRDFLLG